MKTYNIGIVGIGKISQVFHIPAILEIKECKLIALCDTNINLLNEVGKKYNINNLYTKYDEFLNNKAIEIVIIATPNYLHCAQTIKALEAGKHVAVEKPMALTLAEANKMITSSSKNKKKLMVLHHNRFREESILIKKEINQGKLGNIFYLRGSILLSRGVPEANHFSFDSAKGGGPLYDSGAHIVDIALWFLEFKQIKEIKSYKWNKQVATGKIKVKNKIISEKNYNCEDFIVATIEFEDGTLVNLEVSYLHNLGKDIVNCTIFGDEGCAIWPNPIIYMNNGNNVKNKRLPIDNTIYASIKQIKHFIDHISKGEELQVPLQHSAIVVDILEKIHKFANKRISNYAKRKI